MRPHTAVPSARFALTALLLFVVPLALAAQSVRVSGVSTLQTIDLRPFIEDSVPIAQATGTGPYRDLADGTVVRCIDGQAYCRYRRSGNRVRTAPVLQDLIASAWGFGQGVSLHSHLRLRSSLGGGELLWPRANDHFDALEAYLQVDRDRWRARLGRQWATNGLGAYNFDGGSLIWRRGAAWAEAFGGISLVAGLNEAHDGPLLGHVDDLPPDERGTLLGFRTGARLGDYGSLSATYQRVIRSDRGSLYGERAAVDAVGRLLGTSLDASLIYDFIGAQLNEGSLRASRQLPARLSASAELRRHRPYFESWTIWGAFSPVGFDEARGTLGWRNVHSTLALDARGGWRRYEDAGAGSETLPLRSGGWRAGAGAEWTPDPRWLWYGDYDVDIGFGAARSDFTAGTRFTPGETYFIGGALSALQNVYEFRLGTGRVTGVRLEGGSRLGSDARLVLDGAFYHHTSPGSVPTPDWGQTRFSIRLEWAIGRDPGEAAPVAARNER